MPCVSFICVPLNICCGKVFRYSAENVDRNVQPHTDDVVAKTMKVIAPGGRLHQWAALCMSHRCIHTTGRQRSVARLSVVDPERARLLTSFYYQGAIDKAANKVCILSLS